MRITDILLALTAVTFWGLNITAAKVGLGEIPPIFFAALRLGLVALLLVPFVRYPKGQMKQVAWFSVFFGALHFGFLYTGLADMDSASAAITIQLGVPISVLLAWIFLGERFGIWRSVGLALAFSGVVVLAGDPALISIWPVICVALGIGGWAASNIAVKNIHGVPALSISAWGSLFSAIQLFAVSAVLETNQAESLVSASWLTFAMILYTAVPATLVAHSLWYHLLSKYDVNAVVPFNLLTPVIGVIGGIWLLGEPMTWQKAVGGITTMAGVALIQWRNAKKAKTHAIVDEPT